MIEPLLVRADARPRPDFLTGTKGLYIGGTEVAARSGQTFETIDPVTEQPIATISFAGADDVDAAVAAARRAFEDPAWAGIAPYRRTQLLLQVADIIEANVDELAALESLEMGSAYTQTQWMINHCVEVFRNHAGWPTKLYGQTAPAPSTQLQYTLRQPLGVAGAIAGWNGPLLQMSYKLAPALATGNTVVCKPSEHTSLSTLRFADLLRQTDLPAGVVNVITGDGKVTGERLMSHDGVNKVAFTGSTATGKHILATSASNLKRVTLELGGKTPYIVFADADLEKAAEICALAFCAGSGQACVAGSRIFVQEPVRDKFVELLAQATEPYKAGLGDPFHPGTKMGPLAFRGHFERVTNYIELATDAGGTLVTGAEPIDGGGLYVAPTLIDGLDNKSRVAQEEIFGPVSMIMPFTELDEVVRLGNDTIFGLAASVWTRDIGTAHRAAARLDAGSVWINRGSQMSAGPLPFGGHKQSGIGREHGTEVLDAYTESKSVVVELS
ncbi:aldehyde dehydrogenase [Amycolatopsis sp. GM8]|uniref:aldehyde dehydrogenase family protein n=1 Tax=Amycolatopsis sp. GM8 TaxID=2896530 RepID=UPI001F40564B|nr:aldehyde dehydrogenase family protein [Amycolatopsis sp. GM8]